jgi:hypothetical protein
MGDILERELRGIVIGPSAAVGTIASAIGSAFAVKEMIL